MEKRKKTAREKPLQQVSEKELELNIEDIYPKDKGLGFFFSFKYISRSTSLNFTYLIFNKFKFHFALPGLGFPRRPPWNYGMAREDLLKKEEKSFRLYLDDLLSRNPLGSLSHFEHNLEVNDWFLQENMVWS